MHGIASTYFFAVPPFLSLEQLYLLSSEWDQVFGPESLCPSIRTSYLASHCEFLKGSEKKVQPTSGRVVPYELLLSGSNEFSTSEWYT